MNYLACSHLKDFYKLISYIELLVGRELKEHEKTVIACTMNNTYGEGYLEAALAVEKGEFKAGKHNKDGEKSKVR